MKLIGRHSELERLSLALSRGRSVLLEGPVGVGKTLLANHAAHALGRTVIRVDGDSRYSEAKLVGTWDPQSVLNRGYSHESFQPGPLAQAMQHGSVLFLNELNRMPESVQNILLPALDDREIQVPHLGPLRAQAGFVVVATQNPRDFVGTSLLSEALLDRLDWIFLDHPSFEEEVEILLSRTQDSSPKRREYALLATELLRLTRNHPKIKRGASLRAGIGILDLLGDEPSSERFWQAVRMTLPTRIELQPGAQLPGAHLAQQMDALITELELELKKKS